MNISKKFSQKYLIIFSLLLILLMASFSVLIVNLSKIEVLAEEEPELVLNGEDIVWIDNISNYKELGAEIKNVENLANYTCVPSLPEVYGASSYIVKYVADNAITGWHSEKQRIIYIDENKSYMNDLNLVGESSKTYYKNQYDAYIDEGLNFGEINEKYIGQGEINGNYYLIDLDDGGINFGIPGIYTFKYTIKYLYSTSEETKILTRTIKIENKELSFIIGAVNQVKYYVGIKYGVTVNISGFDDNSSVKLRVETPSGQIKEYQTKNLVVRFDDVGTYKLSIVVDEMYESPKKEIMLYDETAQVNSLATTLVVVAFVVIILAFTITYIILKYRAKKIEENIRQ